MCTTGEWVDTKLYQVIESYPEYFNYGLYVWDSDEADSELFYLGEIPQVYEQYKDNYVFFTDEDEQCVWLEGTVDELGD